MPRVYLIRLASEHPLNLTCYERQYLLKGRERAWVKCQTLLKQRRQEEPDSPWEDALLFATDKDLYELWRRVAVDDLFSKELWEVLEQSQLLDAYNGQWCELWRAHEA